MNDLTEFEQTSLSELLTNSNGNLKQFEDILAKEKYQSFHEILMAHDIILDKADQREEELDKKLLQIEQDIKINTVCDKWDYIFAGSAGFLAGLIDSLFVGSPTDSRLLSSADSMMDTLVQKFAKLNGWPGAKGDSDPIKSAIGYLEREFKVNYDQRHSADVSGIFTMSASNHHLKSLAHSPSPIGLIFSIIDQIKGTATFLDNGYLITIDSESNLQGKTIPAKIFAAFVNWIGHIMSDIAGSSGASGPGSGIPIPFYELLQSLNIGSFGADKKSLAEIAVKVFEKGYDFRFGMAQSIPVVLTELFIRLFCIIRHRFEYKRDWSDCLTFLKFDSNPRLRKMLLTGHGVLCLIDAGDAFVRSDFANNWIDFFSRLNCVAWMRFSYLGALHAFSILNNEIEIQRYKMRAEAFDQYVKDVTKLVDLFLIEHQRKMDRFFLERKKELDNLFNQLEKELKAKNHLAASNHIKQIGEQYGFKSRMMPFEEFCHKYDDDEY